MTGATRPLVYVAAPYTHPDPVQNTHDAINAGMRLWEGGRCVPIIPHLNLIAHLVAPRPTDYWYDLDLAQVEHCDALVRLPGDSTGADCEVEHARTRSIPVYDGLDAVEGALRRGEIATRLDA